MDTLGPVTPVEISYSQRSPARSATTPSPDSGEHLNDFNEAACKHNVALVAINVLYKKPYPRGLSKKAEELQRSYCIKEALGDMEALTKPVTFDVLEQQTLEHLCTAYGTTTFEHLPSRYHEKTAPLMRPTS